MSYHPGFWRSNKNVWLPCWNRLRLKRSLEETGRHRWEHQPSNGHPGSPLGLQAGYSVNYRGKSQRPSSRRITSSERRSVGGLAMKQNQMVLRSDSDHENAKTLTTPLFWSPDLLRRPILNIKLHKNFTFFLISFIATIVHLRDSV